MTVRVVASNINSDGVPEVGDDTDQDFALACYNCYNEPNYTLAVQPSALQICTSDVATATIRVGQILGPIEMEGRFAVLRLDRPIEPYYVPYEKVRRQVVFQVKKQKADAAFEEAIAEIRDRSASQVTWHDENISLVASRSGGA